MKYSTTLYRESSRSYAGIFWDAYTVTIGFKVAG